MLSAADGKHHARVLGKRLRATTMVEESWLLAMIRCPVLSIMGSEGFQDDPHAVGSMLPKYHAEILPGQGHSVLVETHRTVRGPLLDRVAGHELVNA